MSKKYIVSLWGKLPLEHCCLSMDYCVVDIAVPVVYFPIFREYRIQNIKSRYTSYVITYCPWCGCKLPKSLRDAWFETLKSEYGLEAHIDMLFNPELPEEFKSDAWWKERNL